jgi:hypothetical protein
MQLKQTQKHLRPKDFLLGKQIRKQPRSSGRGSGANAKAHAAKNTSGWWNVLHGEGGWG